MSVTDRHGRSHNQPRNGTRKWIRGQVVLLTGGTGSFGRKFTELVLRDHAPSELIVYSRDEMKQYQMRQQFPQKNLRFIIGDVRDPPRLNEAMKGVDVVIHAAALKHILVCEEHPVEAIKTNILGSANVIDAAIDNGVKRVMAVTTDKAVNPINLYGATKLCAEKLMVQANALARPDGPQFACARYGNVVGSRGSVIPLFFDQRRSGKVTVTDRRMTRFWITLEQAVQFVIGCLQEMQGGEIFVPRIPSMSVLDLVGAIAPTAKIQYTGIRAGEKLHELLVSPDESRQVLRFKEKFVIRPAQPWWKAGLWSEGETVPDGFFYSSENNPERLSGEQLRKMAAEFEPQSPLPVLGRV